jgi:hypothetical protein
MHFINAPHFKKNYVDDFFNVITELIFKIKGILIYFLKNYYAP